MRNAECGNSELLPGFRYGPAGDQQEMISLMCSHAPKFSRVSSQFSFETSAHDGANHCADDGSGHEFGEPMDGHGDAETDVKRIKQRAENQRLVFRPECNEAGHHGKRHGGVRRGPAPEDAAFEETELETAA